MRFTKAYIPAGFAWTTPMAQWRGPKRVDVVADMPRTASGTIREAALRRHDGATHTSATEA